MDRSIVYTQEQGRSTDFLFAQRAAMVGLGQLAQAMLGTSTLVFGLGVTPTSPASLSVNVAPGQIYSQQPVDATAYGVLPADTTDQVVKQGLMAATLNLLTPAPSTAGYSINYLIQAAYQDQDTNPDVLPYFNSANPSQPLSGQNNSGAAQATERQGVCVVAVKAGAAAATGSQTTPAPDAGYVGLVVVTVAYGQTQVIAGNISAYSGAPVISSLLAMMQASSAITAPDTGVANAYAITLAPAPAALTPGMMVKVENFLNTSTSTAPTLNVNGLGGKPIVFPGGAALAGGELVAGYGAIFMLNHAGTAWILLASTGADVGPTPAAGDNSTKRATTAFIQRVQPGNAQTMQNMTTARAMSTVYTNNEPNPIVIGVYGSMNTAATGLLCALNGFTATPITGSQAASASNDSSLIVEVPSGWTYEVYPSSGSVSGFSWMERR